MVRNDFSIENLTSSIYGNGSRKNVKSTEASTAFVRAGVMPTLFESCESVEHYAMVAMENYNEGERLGSFAVLAMESLASNIVLLSNVNKSLKARGVESFRFSIEAAGFDVKGIIKKAVFAVKSAIQKFIVAVGNFIKSISNWFGSQFVGAQEKVYLDAKAKGIAGLISKAGDAKINAIKLADRAKVFNAEIFKGLDVIGNAAAGVELGGATAPDLEAAAKGVRSGFNYLIQGNAAAKKYIDETLGSETGGVITKIPSGSVVARIHVYGSADAKPEEVAIKDLASEAEYAILTKAHAQAFLKAVNTAKKASADMNKALKAADGIMAEVAKPDSGDAAAAKAKMRALMFAKNAHGFNVGFLLTYYSLYLKERSILTRALKSISGGAAKEDKKALPAAK